MTLAQPITPFQDELECVLQEKYYTLGWKDARDQHPAKHGLGRDHQPHYDAGRRDATHAMQMGRDIRWSLRWDLGDSSGPGIADGDSMAWGTKGQLQKAS